MTGLGSKAEPYLVVFQHHLLIEKKTTYWKYRNLKSLFGAKIDVPGGKINVTLPPNTRMAKMSTKGRMPV
jgi:hypothetical protein